jgi:hypothetical protein
VHDPGRVLNVTDVRVQIGFDIPSGRVLAAAAPYLSLWVARRDGPRRGAVARGVVNPRLRWDTSRS